MGPAAGVSSAPTATPPARKRCSTRWRARCELGIKWLTVYAFSTENWKRPTDEVRFLMGFNESILLARRDEMNERGVRMRFVGRRDWRVPKRLIMRPGRARSS